PPSTALCPPSLHDALPIFCAHGGLRIAGQERIDQYARVPLAQLEARVPEEANVHFSPPVGVVPVRVPAPSPRPPPPSSPSGSPRDRKSTRLNSSHQIISYA